MTPDELRELFAKSKGSLSGMVKILDAKGMSINEIGETLNINNEWVKEALKK